MDSSKVVHSLREWAPLTVLEKIPTRILSGIFPTDLNITCIDAIPEFLALGTDNGVIFWYNRHTAEHQKLKTELLSPISCIKIVSSVEYMIAAGTRNGQVNIFQIQKEIPPDLGLSVLLTRSNPIQRYTIRDLHKSAITCCEWSKNGMKLFSGDKSGIVVLTEFDYQNNLSKSCEIINETYSVVQLSLHQQFLLISTLYRTIICEPTKSKENDGKCDVLQIGKTERKILGEFGATFKQEGLKPPKIIACRPSFRFWIANVDGVVEKTYIFKDASEMRTSWEVPLLNPNRKRLNSQLKNFTCIHPFLNKFYVTNDDCSLYILNLEELKIESIARNFRQIIDFAICENEIFILEGGRCLIRLSNKPEPPSQKAAIIFNPLLPPPIPHMGIFEAPIEFSEEENIIGAEECFELPPIEFENSNIPIETHIDSPDTETKKIEAENKSRIVIFQKIGEQDFDEEIVFRGKKNKKKIRKKIEEQQSQNTAEGIIEIGHNAMTDAMVNNDSVSLSEIATENPKNKKTITTKPQHVDVSICTESMISSQHEYYDSDLLDITTDSIEKTRNYSPLSGGKEADEYSFNLPKWQSVNYPISPSSPVKNATNVLEQNDKIEEIQNQSPRTVAKDDDDKVKEISSEIKALSPDLGGRGDELKMADIPTHLQISSIFGTTNENIEVLDTCSTAANTSNGANNCDWEFVSDCNNSDDMAAFEISKNIPE